MQLKDFPLFSRELIRFDCTESVAGWMPGELVEIYRLDEGYQIRQGDQVCYAEASQKKAKVDLLVARDSTMWIVARCQSTTLQLQWLELIEQSELNVELAVNDDIVKYLAKRREIADADMQAALAWLEEHFIVSTPQDGGRIFLGSFENTAKDDFLILGAGWRATVTRAEEKWKLQALTRLPNEAPRLSSAVGSILFYDASVATYLRSEEQKAKMDALLRDNGSYLQQWQEYGALEWEASKRIAQKLGSIRYSYATSVDGEQSAWFLKVDDLADLNAFRKIWRELGLPFDTYVELGKQAQDYEVEEELDGKRSSWQEKPLRGQIQFEKHGITLTPNQDRRNEKPPAAGYLYYSLAGDETVKNRRARAKKSIDESRRMSQLRYLLEGVTIPRIKPDSESGLSAYARACFKGPPTERQKTALEVALNTPDIALIVGPPGTGKTQVIAALERRLAETLKVKTLQHQVLISSYQHDAVENALSRAEVFGLPPVRVGSKKRGSEGGVDPVKVWCQRKSQEVETILAETLEADPAAKPLAELSRRLVLLRVAKMRAEERLQEILILDKLLKELAIHQVRLPRGLQEKWSAYVNSESIAVTPRIAPEKHLLMRLVRALRTTEVGFADDGADRAYHLGRALGRNSVELSESERSLLKEMAVTTTASEGQLRALATLKDRLIDRLLPDYRPPALKQSIGDEARSLFDNIEQAIEGPIKRSHHGVFSVIARYRAALLQAPERAEDTVRDYATIVGATCQQSASKAMSSLKSLSDLDASEEIEFNTVVVDEAARANPLDLFVPMAMAKQRIILVGDHRQLPHILEPELESELQSRLSLNEEQVLAHKQSLFERLLIQLRRQESVDNIRRVVMLDTQYRMHPILGDFVSKQFYESEGLDRLRSGRPASDFAHALPGYEGKVCAWLNVPSDLGYEYSHRPGYSRRVEAEIIAREVKRLADAGGEALSLGVISFYRAQTDAILREMVSHGLAEEDDGEIRIAKAYRQTAAGEERLRVGTVDAFQGKEFDVVLLSVVRSNDKKISPALGAEDREKYWNSKYGHLRLSNRLNVAMSRQRKLLIAVGDQGMADSGEALMAVPGLAAFLALCRRESHRVH